MRSLFVSCAPIALLATTLAYAGEPEARTPAAASQGTTEQTPGPVTEDTLRPGPFDKGAVGVEFGFGLLGEAWNLNSGREWLADGTLSVWWAFANRASLVAEVHATRVFQEPSRDAFVTGIAPLVRFQVLNKEALDLFTEIGAGASWSDTVVPPRGTRFNYVALAGLGVARRLGRQTHAIAGFRWLHLSNNGREGRSRNPDIQALGPYGALAVGF
jgi:hypothetical protein